MYIYIYIGVHFLRTQKTSENLTLFIISSRKINRRKHVN